MKDNYKQHPLFEAPLTDARDYVGPGQCGILGMDSEHCFKAKDGSITSLEAHIANKIVVPKDTERGFAEELNIKKGFTQELLSAPLYSSWQTESWLFHCDLPMVYLGAWSKSDFDQKEELGKSIINELYDEWGKYYSIERDLAFGSVLSGKTAFQMFRCQKCQSHRCSWDYS